MRRQYEVLRTRQLKKTYGKGTGSFQALKGVNLEILDGESLAVVGKSGSGKSTLMHLLALLDEPTGGEIVLDGVRATSLRGNELNKVRNQTFG